MKWITGAIFCVLLAACGPNEKQRAELAEQKRIECLDKFCPGDIEPKRDYATEALLKINGQWFIGPEKYFSSGHSSGFYWPSKTPMFSGLREFPEQGQDFYDVAIEIFFRSNNIPSGPRGFQGLQKLEAEGRIFDRKSLRKGLHSLRIRNEDGSMPRGTVYIATEIKGIDGLPPLAICYHNDPRDGGGAGFMWQDGVFVGIRMNQKHCADWPEIYLEITRVLALLKKV